MSPEVQEYVLSTGLPWFEDRLREGVVGEPGRVVELGAQVTI